MFTLKNSISPKFKTAIFAISPKFKMPIFAISPKFGGALASDFRQISEILPPISDKFQRFCLRFPTKALNLHCKAKNVDYGI